MHAAAVVAEHGAGERERGGQFGQRGGAGEGDAVRRGGGRDLLAGRVFRRGAEGHDRAAGLRDERGGGLGVAFDRPLLGGSARGAGQDGDPRPRQVGEFPAHGRHGRFRHGQPRRREQAAVFSGKKRSRYSYT